MSTLRLYLPELVLLAWAVVIWRVGRTDLIMIVGLCGTAFAVWVCTRELICRYQEHAHGRQRHPS